MQRRILRTSQLQIPTWLAVPKRLRDFGPSHLRPSLSLTGVVVLQEEEEEEGLQQAEEKGAERGTELTFGVRGVASEGDVEVPIEEASPPADDC